MGGSVRCGTLLYGHRPTKRTHKTDTLTIQAAAIKEHCAPNPEFGEGCALNIGVHAWSNTSYSILVRPYYLEGNDLGACAMRVSNQARTQRIPPPAITTLTQATLNRGWASPIELAPGQPQTGTVAKSMYAYYSVKIPGSVSGEQRPVVRVTLLPAGGKDQDLLVCMLWIGNLSSRWLIRLT